LSVSYRKVRPIRVQIILLYIQIYCFVVTEKKGIVTCGQSKGNIDPNSATGICLNPYTMPDALLFKGKVSAWGLELIPDEGACSANNISVNLVKTTIDALNLNSQRLCMKRVEVWDEYHMLIEIFNMSTVSEQKILVDRFQLDYKAVTEFITTVRWSLHDFLFKRGG
jgi:hypothetical protein